VERGGHNPLAEDDLRVPGSQPCVHGCDDRRARLPRRYRIEVNAVAADDRGMPKVRIRRHGRQFKAAVETGTYLKL
jgi:hypothetical protein